MTFSHWSGVTPYTSSYEFAGSCVFGKQLPEKLSLRPARLRNQRRGDGHAFTAFPFTTRVRYSIGQVSLLPKLRLLFCRVPWKTITRSPSSARRDHLCWFSVRFRIHWSLEVFLGSVLLSVYPGEPEHSVRHLEAVLKPETRICLNLILQRPTKIQ